MRTLLRPWMTRRLTAMLAVLGAALANGGQAWSQTAPFPAKPVTLVSPFAAGGTSDAVARAIGKQLESELKQPVVVVNRTGAGGTLGIASVVTAAADGYTLVLGGLGSVVFPSVIYKGRIKFDPAKDLVPVAAVGSAPTLIAVRASLPAKSLADLVASAKRDPNKLSYASAGVGGTLHVAGVLLEREASIELNHIPYRGGAPAMTDVAGGSTDIALADLTLALPFLQGGKIRALAVASGQRSPLLPDVPTTAEAGLPNVRMDTWYAIFAPAGTPTAVLERLQSAVVQARKHPAFAALLSSQGITPVNSSPAEFKAQLKTDFDTWLPVLTRICSQTSCE